MEALKERYPQFFEAIEKTYDAERIATIEQAVCDADALLAGMKRWDGTELVNHSIAGALIVVSEIGLGRTSTIAMLLHDAVRLSLITLTEVAEKYGEEVVSVLRGMNLISKIRTNTQERQVENFRDMIIGYSTDPRVILIKLADRLEVMRSLAIFPEAKRTKKSWESMNLYAPIAHKLGLYAVKSELEDLSLKWLEPADYVAIETALRESASEREKFIADFIAPIQQKLSETSLKFHIKGRTKSVYSIWRKMHRTNVALEEVYDIFAIRIIIDCPPEMEKQLCWGVYSVVTDFYIPNPDRMRDWISIPKSNGYESLHTTVVTKMGRWVEIQIRSERMDVVAEKGIAAHWRYKGVSGDRQTEQEWLGRIREMLEEGDGQLPQRLDVLPQSGEIFVFTPKGDLRKLPEGAVVLDFAYDIHSNIGERCTGAQIGEKIVPIKEKLRNGDIVSIITAKNQHPKADWLKIVYTAKARSRIKLYLREEQAKRAAIGREELERKLKNWKLSVTMDDAVNALCRYCKYRTGMELYGQIAAEKVNMNDLRSVLERFVAGELFAPKTKGTAKVQLKESSDGGDALIIDEKVRGIDYKMARCCNPVRGDGVFGFTTISKGITIHRNDCPNASRLREQYPYRIIEVRWKESTEGVFLAKINLVADDNVGVVGRITDYITKELKLNIRSLSLVPSKDGLRGSVTIEVPSVGVLNMVVFNLAKIKGVTKAYRISQ